jgi:hypothetical protein
VFTTLDEEMKRDDAAATTLQGRCLRYVAVFFVSALLFGGLYLGIRYLE